MTRAPCPCWWARVTSLILRAATCRETDGCPGVRRIEAYFEMPFVARNQVFLGRMVFAQSQFTAKMFT